MLEKLFASEKDSTCLLCDCYKYGSPTHLSLQDIIQNQTSSLLLNARVEYQIPHLAHISSLRRLSPTSSTHSYKTNHEVNNTFLGLQRPCPHIFRGHFSSDFHRRRDRLLMRPYSNRLSLPFLHHRSRPQHHRHNPRIHHHGLRRPILQPHYSIKHHAPTNNTELKPFRHRPQPSFCQQHHDGGSHDAGHERHLDGGGKPEYRYQCCGCGS